MTKCVTLALSTQLVIRNSNMGHLSQRRENRGGERGSLSPPDRVQELNNNSTSLDQNNQNKMSVLPADCNFGHLDVLIQATLVNIPQKSLFFPPVRTELLCNLLYVARSYIQFT